MTPATKKPPSLLRLLESRELRSGSNRQLDNQLAASLVSGFPFRTEIRGSFSCVNAIALSKDGSTLFTGGDDKRVLLYSLADDPTKLKPARSYPGHQSNIFCIAPVGDGKRFYSAGNDGLIISHDAERGLGSVTLAHDEGCLSISLSAMDQNSLLSAGHDGFVKLWDVREGETVGAIPNNHEMNSVAFSPTAPHIFVASGNRSDLALYDSRMCFTNGVSRRERALVKFNLKLHVVSENRHVRFLDVTNVAFAPNGRNITATVSKWLPTVYDITDPMPVCVLDHQPEGTEEADSPRYRCAVTVKTCNYGTYGGKEVFLSGSDDFSGFVWELPRSFAELGEESKLSGVGFFQDGETKFPPIIKRADHVLLGARSITNSALMHPTLPWIFTAGVEKVVRLHSAVALDDSPAEAAPPKKRESLVANPEGRRRVLRHIIIGDGLAEDDETEVGEDEQTLGFFDMLNHREERSERVGGLSEAILLPPGHPPFSDSDDSDNNQDGDAGLTSGSDSSDAEFEEWLMEGAEESLELNEDDDEEMENEVVEEENGSENGEEEQAGEEGNGEIGHRGMKRRRESS